jgi:hypothetical protein
MGLIVTMYNCHVSVRMAMYMKLAYTDSLEPYTNDTVLMPDLYFPQKQRSFIISKWNVHQCCGILQRAHIAYAMYSLKITDLRVVMS